MGWPKTQILKVQRLKTQMAKANRKKAAKKKISAMIPNIQSQNNLLE